MDHDMVVRQKMTERYLLKELDPAARDEFEEHFFDCKDCAFDVHAGALFVEQSKVVLAEKPEPVAAALPATASVRDRLPESGYLSTTAAGIEQSAGLAVGTGECRHLRIRGAGDNCASWGRFSPFCEDTA